VLVQQWGVWVTGRSVDQNSQQIRVPSHVTFGMESFMCLPHRQTAHERRRGVPSALDADQVVIHKDMIAKYEDEMMQRYNSDA
jgi:hypothetical protein